MVVVIILTPSIYRFVTATRQLAKQIDTLINLTHHKDHRSEIRGKMKIIYWIIMLTTVGYLVPYLANSPGCEKYVNWKCTDYYHKHQHIGAIVYK